MPTVLVRAGADVPQPTVPARVRTVEAEVWDDTFGLTPDLCLVVRPDQHVAARCPVVDAANLLERLTMNPTATNGAASHDQHHPARAQ